MFNRKPEMLRVSLSEVIHADDSEVRRVLEGVLASLSAIRLKNEVVGPIGSQEISTEIYKIDDYIVKVTEETYRGVELSGPKLLISKIVSNIFDEVRS